jgi:hypothetical protein
MKESLNLYSLLAKPVVASSAGAGATYGHADVFVQRTLAPTLDEKPSKRTENPEYDQADNHKDSGHRALIVTR